MAKEYLEVQKKLFGKKFKEFCSKSFSGDIEFLEQTRKKYLLYIGIVAILAALILIFLSVSFKGESNDVIGPLILTTFGPASVIVKHYKKKAKNLILNKLLAFVGDIKYIEKNMYYYDDRRYIDSLGLFDYYNRYSCDDRLKGTYNNLSIDILEIKLEKETGTGKERRVERVFKGIFIKVPCNKKFKTKTIIKANTFRIGDFGNRVKLEDPEFEKIYNVYSSDQIEARYLITTAFMERMVDLNRKNNNIILSFEQGNVNIGLFTKTDWFELSIFKPANDLKQYKEILLQIMTILSIIDSLKLEQNIGL